jgi:hypothetical protein
MIETYYDALNQEELNFLNNECNSFISDEEPSGFDIREKKKNYYFRKFIPENKMFCFYDKILSKLHDKRNIKYHINGIWINKINSDSNKNDKYHQDISDLTIIIFLNDSFTGGEFEYFDEDKKKIKIIPKKNKALVMDNKLVHRVLPVTYGDRFTLVCFFEFDKKEIKSLI